MRPAFHEVSLLSGGHRSPRWQVPVWGTEQARSGVFVHKDVEYTATQKQILLGKSAIMALNAVEETVGQVSVDYFQTLEEKVYRTIEMYKSARQAQAAAERDSQRARQQLEERDEQLDTLRREAVQLRKEREEVRARVEKMLAQIESIAEEQAS